MYSYPNLIPLGGDDVARIAAAVRRYRFDRIYGAFDGRQIPTEAADAVERSARRYIERLAGSPGGATARRSGPRAPEGG
jgi:hypothetical protein